MINTPGQSGQPGSPFYDNLAKLGATKYFQLARARQWTRRRSIGSFCPRNEARCGWSSIAFLRAINVGGSSIVRMADLREAFVTAGCRNVRSYIASGNILFESGVSNDVALVRRVRRAIADRLEMNPAIMLHALKELEALVARDPFRKLRQDHAINSTSRSWPRGLRRPSNSAHP